MTSEYKNIEVADAFSNVRNSGEDEVECRLCYCLVHWLSTNDHVVWHNEMGYKLWSLQALIDGLAVVQELAEPFSQDVWVGHLDDGDAVVDRDGRVWTVCRDGGMVVRPVPENTASNMESAGLHWLETNHGPVVVVWSAKRDNEKVSSGQ